MVLNRSHEFDVTWIERMVLRVWGRTLFSLSISLFQRFVESKTVCIFIADTKELFSYLIILKEKTSESTEQVALTIHASLNK